MALFEDFSAAPFRLEFRPPAARNCVSDTQLSQLTGRHHTLNLAARREFYASGETTGDHRHLDFVALYAVRGGEGLHVTNGAPSALSKGDIYLLAPGSVHSYVRYYNLELDALYFAPDLLRAEELEALRVLSGFWSLFAEDAARPNRDSDPRLHLRPEEWKSIEAQLATVHALWRGDDAASPLLLRQTIFALLIHLAWRWEARPQLAPARSEVSPAPTISDAVCWCEENFAQPLQVPQLAARMFLSPGHFSQRFTREVGVAPAAFIRRLRLEKARALLRETDWPLTRIADETGFADAAHLARSFRSYYGLTPGAFRRGENSGAN